MTSEETADGAPARTEPPRRTIWTRGQWLAAAAVLTALLTAGHRVVPNSPGGLGSLLEAFLPWTGAAVALLALAAGLRRSATAGVAVLVAAAVWAAVFAGRFTAAEGPAGDGALTVAQHNVSDTDADPAGTARALGRTGADLVAVQELTDRARGVYRTVLAASGYRHHAVHGTVGLWSRHPLSGDRPLDIRPPGIAPGWQRALRVRAEVPGGAVAVYVAHLPSVRMGLSGFGSGLRDEAARRLGRELRREPLERVLVAGDLNATLDDRALAPVRAVADEPSSDPAFAFTWPASFPVARIDHVLSGGGEVTDLRAVDVGGSDHLALLAHVRF